MTISSNISDIGELPLEGKSILGGYLDQLWRTPDSEKNPKKIALLFGNNLGNEYFLGILQALSEIDRECREMKSILKEFTGKDFGLFKILTIEHVATEMKLYVISWATVIDLLAYLINLVFDLGIDDRDVREYLVLNNKHVKSSLIPQILKNYNETSLIKDLKRKRNALVHRGKIPDEDIEKILQERNIIDSKRYSLLQKDLITEEEYKKQVSHLQQKLDLLAKDKQKIWEKHHSQTIEMAQEITRELANKTVKVLKLMEA